MAIDYLHNHKEFPKLLEIISAETGIITQLIEKDYWIMHALYGLKKQGFEFQLKGGTSLSKGYKIIDRFSEDLDIHIVPDPALNVESNHKRIKPQHIESRKQYYDWLAKKIKIDGIESIERDTVFDNTNTYNSGGIRLNYGSVTEEIEGLKYGILLEVGFDTVTPNNPMTINSWAYDKAVNTKGIEIIDNRAIDVQCYSPGYTLVEKLQTITRKFRQEEEGGEERQNLMRQYYDIYCLLENPDVKKFIGTDEYKAHKAERFRGKDTEIAIKDNEAFLLSDKSKREQFIKRYKKTSALYYNGQPEFEEILQRIHANIDIL